MEYFDPEAGLGVPVIKPGMRMEISRWIFREQVMRKGRRKELAQRYGHQRRQNLIDPASKIGTVPK